ncbi:transposase [Lysinibacillus sphaericus OT4b.31]|uniref:Transposase n=1 Tax=Lysinibacillus sphaericus OT4b.31 TaxID=1285586 RepID=R7ZJP8_LYSSH|nr:transposase [Lysinibacillus sphaericus OT4b.31]
MTKNSNHERHPLEILTIDQMVPEGHLVENLYSPRDRPCVNPVVLYKLKITSKENQRGDFYQALL